MKKNDQNFNPYLLKDTPSGMFVLSLLMTGVAVTTLCGEGGEGRKASFSNCSPICTHRVSNSSNESADFVKSL
jgi:hypothetical protein